ncbi:MAG: hypothetical protein IK064_05000, partial [Clostridia bacterium]|nr:hypothetical protein [Clostridia bacterium]
KIRSIVKSAVLLFVLLFLVMAVPLFVFRGSIADKLIGDQGAETSIVIVMLCIFMTGIENILKSVHLAACRIVRTSVSELTEQTVRFILVFLLLRNNAGGADHHKTALILLGMLGSEFFSVGFLAYSFEKLFPRAHNIGRMKPGKSIAKLTAVLIPAALTSIAGTVFASAGTLLLPGRLIIAGYTRQRALSAIGALNTAAVPLVMLPMAFVGAVSVVTLQEISAAYSRSDLAAVRRTAKKSMSAVCAAFIIVNVAALPFLGRISFALFGIMPSRLCFLLLTVKAGIIYMTVISTAVMNGMMRQRAVLVFAVAGESLQLILIVLLSAVKVMHIYGYLASMCIGEGLRLAAVLIYLRHSLARGNDKK